MSAHCCKNSPPFMLHELRVLWPIRIYGKGFFMAFLLFLSHSTVVRAWSVDSLREAATHGNRHAASCYSLCVRTGFGVAPDGHSAFQWATKGMDTTDGFSLYCLAECYRRGCGTGMDLAKALSLSSRAVPRLQQSAARSPEVLYALSECFAHGMGTAVREDSASALLRQAADSLFAPAASAYFPTVLGAARSERDSIVAIAYLRSAADQLYCPAMAQLAGMYAQRPASEDLAWLYAHRAALLGYANAQYQCGAFCYAAVGTRRDTIQSERWFRQAALGGLLQAHAELGYRYAHGLGMQKNIAAARRYFVQALCLSDDEHEGLANFVHQQLDSLRCSNEEWQATLRDVCTDVQEAEAKQGYPGRYSSPALYGMSRRLWREWSGPGGDATLKTTYLTCSRNGSARTAMIESDSVTQRRVGQWWLSQDGQQLQLRYESDTVRYKVALLSPGMLVVFDSSQLRCLTRCGESEWNKVHTAFRGSTEFGEMSLRFRRAALSDLGVMSIYVEARDVPADGAVLSLDSVHLPSESFGMNDRKQAFHIDAPEVIVSDGEVLVQYAIRKELKRSVEEGHCQLEFSAAYAIDDAYKQCRLRTPDLSLPQRIK